MQVKVKGKADLIREAALQDLEVFIRLIHPNRVLGDCHKELINWWTRLDGKTHQLALLPRDHQKSALIAYRVAWEITKNPAIRILYISSTSNLATKQLKFIKDILTSDIYRFYWPEMVNPEESKREKWTTEEISVDHPLRKLEVVRDPTIFTAGLTTTIVGMHCDIAVLDDVVIDNNAYNAEGRLKVKDQVSYLASIGGAESSLWAVGTRYHPLDLYNDMLDMLIDIYNPDGEVVSSEPLYEIFERQVEDRGDGTGQFLWPRQQRGDGKWFGFNREILAKKRAQYSDPTKFRAQYYNNPNDVGSATIDSSMFQKYNKELLRQEQGFWYYKDRRLNVFASIDFAYSTKKQADFTVIIVVGVDVNQNYYVLDIDRFKTASISEYFDRILRLHVKWNFRKLRAEVSVAQQVIVKDLKDSYIRVHGLALTIDEHRPTRHQGTKEERIEAILQHKYQNKQMFHYSGGNCELLEEELRMQRPPHDDIKDALASCIEICIPPTHQAMVTRQNKFKVNSVSHPRFGGLG